MERVAFKMKLKAGYEQIYQQRHDEVWPELVGLLKDTQIQNYSIFLDEETLFLFAILWIPNQEYLEKLPENPVMQKWWAYMQDIMETNPDNSPIAIPLKEVFYLA